jgi:hypothetical protein
MVVAMWHMTPLPAVGLLDATAHPTLFFAVQALLTGAVLILERRYLRNGFSALLPPEESARSSPHGLPSASVKRRVRDSFCAEFVAKNCADT